MNPLVLLWILNAPVTAPSDARTGDEEIVRNLDVLENWDLLDKLDVLDDLDVVGDDEGGAR